MGRPKVNAVHSYFVYDRLARTSKCSICKVDIKGNHATNLLSHLSKHHGNTYTTVVMKNEQHKRETSQNTSSCFDDPSDASPRKRAREERVVHECVNLVTVHGRPFALIDDIAFKNIIKMIPPSSGTNQITVNAVKIKKAVTERAQSIRDIITKEVEGKLVSLKVDCATCIDRSFLGVNLQYIHNKKIVLKTLAVVEMTERHTAEALKLEILSILNMYGISIHQLYTITTDNASNMKKMIKLLGNQQLVNIIQEEDVTEHSDEDDEDAHMVTWNESDDFSDIILSEPYEFSVDAEGSSDTEMNMRNQISHPVVISSPEYNVRSISCAAHTLQLAIGDAFKSCALETIENARKLVKKLRTPTLKGMLKAMKRRKPIIDCVTRWNSTVDMLERLLELRDICEANEELYMPQEAWTEIKSIVQTLTPYRVATKNLQCEQLTFGDLYKEWTCCILRTQKFGTTLSEALVRAMKARKRQLFQSEPFLAGMFMDIRFSILLSAQETMQAMVYIRKIWLHMQRVRKNTSADTAPATAVSGNEESDADEMETLLRNAERKKRRRRNKCTTAIENITNALETYAKHPRLKTKESILEFWENKKLTMPELYELSKIILATPATQVSVERLFSALKFILSPLRSNLSKELVNDILVVRCNHF